MKTFKYNGYSVYIAEKNDLDVRLLQTNHKVFPLSQIISEEGEIVSITNCSYFFEESGYWYTNGRNQGDLLNDIYANAENGLYCDVVIYEDGSWHAGKFNNWDHTNNYREATNGVCAGFSAAGFLVYNGMDVEILSSVPKFNVTGKFTTPNPQTAFAILSDNNMLQIVSDGRNNVGNGLTGHELLAAVRSQGYNNIQLFALLDGGGSSEMIVDGEIVNKPSEGTERKMVNGIAFIKTQSEPEKKDISKATVTLSQNSFEYTGEERMPEVSVVLDGVTLIPETDFILTFENNIEIGSASVVITGTGLYTGIKRVKYEITKISLSRSVDLQWTEEAEMCVYTGEEFVPKFVLYNKNTGQTLVEGIDFEKEYSNNIDVGTEASVRIRGKGFYSGEILNEFTIWPRSLHDVNFTIEEEYVFTGQEIIPIFYLEYNAMILENGNDFEIRCSDNIEAGTATLYIIGNHNYTDSIEHKFNIKKVNINDVSFNMINLPTYTGEKVFPVFEMSLNNYPLIENKDFEVVYSSNIDAGEKSAEIHITGIKNFEGNRIQKFDIFRRNISETNITIGGPVRYDGSTKLPAVTVIFQGKQLEQDKDYEIRGENNVDASENAIVYIVGLKNFIGEEFKYFTILPSEENIFIIELEQNEFIYSGFEHKPKVSLKYNGEDYLDFDVEYKNNINVTDNGAIVTAILKGNYQGTVSKNFTILPVSFDQCEALSATYFFENQNIQAMPYIKLGAYRLENEKDFIILGYENNFNVGDKAVIKYKLSSNFIENDNEYTFNFEILSKDINSQDIVVTFEDGSPNFMFTGEQITPKFYISLNGNKISENDYQFYYSNNINITNFAKIVITGQNNLNGQLDMLFSIREAVLNEHTCQIILQEYDGDNQKGLYNIDTLTVYYLNNMLLVPNQDFQYILNTENNLDAEVVETTITVTGINNFSGEFSATYPTDNLAPGEIADLLQKIERKPGYTYIQYTDAMETMFAISSQGKSAFDELNTQLYNHGYANESVTINTIPIYYLKPNTLIYIKDEATKINGEYVISKINIPLGNSGTMSVTATKAGKRFY